MQETLAKDYLLCYEYCPANAIIKTGENEYSLSINKCLNCKECHPDCETTKIQEEPLICGV